MEADSLRFHRTAAQQRTDMVRDQAHAKAGLIPLRFTHWQIFYDPDYVKETLIAVVSDRRKLRTPESAQIAAAL